jgi:peptidyl-prolyl cis-trans isomerase D
MTTVMDADPADPELAQSVAQLDAQASQSLAGDVLQLFTEALQSDAKITVDQTAIEAVQAQLQ